MEGYVSEIRLFAPNFAPRSWAFCYGQILSISTNQALFSLLGTNYGGNGIQTFALPDFRGRAPMGTGQATSISSFVLGQVSGTNSVTASVLNLPGHTHPGKGSLAIAAYSDAGDKGSPTDNSLASLANLYSNKVSDTTMRPMTPVITIGTTGNNLPIPIQQPYLGLNYIICLQGIFPSRN
jgi:microcystin-dependent protein